MSLKMKCTSTQNDDESRCNVELVNRVRQTEIIRSHLYEKSDSRPVAVIPWKRMVILLIEMLDSFFLSDTSW